MPALSRKKSVQKFEDWMEKFLALLEEAQNTCVLDVVEDRELTLEEVGEILEITRERSRQIELKALSPLKR